MAILRIFAPEECLQTLMPQSKSSKKKEIDWIVHQMEVRQKKGKYHLTFLCRAEDDLSETFEPATGITAETTAQEFIEGQPSNVYNRLHNNYEFWGKDLQSTSFVLDIVDSGYRLPFKDTTPSKCLLKKQQICFKEFGFCQNSYKTAFIRRKN